MDCGLSHFYPEDKGDRFIRDVLFRPGLHVIMVPGHKPNVYGRDNLKCRVKNFCPLHKLRRDI
jgi:hypothetical protein